MRVTESGEQTKRKEGRKEKTQKGRTSGQSKKRGVQRRRRWVNVDNVKVSIPTRTGTNNECFVEGAVVTTTHHSLGTPP